MMMDGFAACFGDLDDPRTGNAGRHDLLEMLMIALCTVLSGGEDCTDMAEFAVTKLGFLRGFLKLEHGAPSHDTFSRLFRLLDPEQFRDCFQRFMAGFAAACHGVVAIDGKVLRRSFDKASGKSALHMVSAWGCEQRLVLAQLATDAKSNEITAVPQLLKMLNLEGCIVTVDALNCQRETARQVIDQKGDYVLALKGNQATLHDDVRTFLDDPQTKLSVSDSTVDADHGRIETRTSMVSTDIEWLQQHHDWPGLTAVGKVVRIRETADKTTTETAYYLLSMAMAPQRLGEVVRSHWAIENRLHWCLDVTMNEDRARNRMDNGPQNLAVLRHMALNLVRKESSKGSLPKKLRRAAWSDAFLARVLAQL
jgi:predicted transposase YbfD/YdcC